MTFRDFYTRVSVIAGQRPFSAEVKASSFGGVSWSAYIQGPGYTALHNDPLCNEHDPESVLESMQRLLSKYVDPPPVPKQEPVGLGDIGEPSAR